MTKQTNRFVPLIVAALSGLALAAPAIAAGGHADVYSNGGRITAQRDVFTQGNRIGARDVYTDGARDIHRPRNAFYDGARSAPYDTFSQGA